MDKNGHVLNIREQEAEAARKRIAAGFVARLGGTLDAMVPALFQTFPTRITYVERYTMACTLAAMIFEQALEELHKRAGNDAPTAREAAIGEIEGAIHDIRSARPT